MFALRPVSAAHRISEPPPTRPAFVSRPAKSSRLRRQRPLEPPCEPPWEPGLEVVPPLEPPLEPLLEVVPEPPGEPPWEPAFAAAANDGEATSAPRARKPADVRRMRGFKNDLREYLTIDDLADLAPALATAPCGALTLAFWSACGCRAPAGRAAAGRRLHRRLRSGGGASGYGTEQSRPPDLGAQQDGVEVRAISAT